MSQTPTVGRSVDWGFAATVGAKLTRPEPATTDYTRNQVREQLADSARRAMPNLRFSYDMLGEAAMTAADAQRYLASYRNAIARIAARFPGATLANTDQGALKGPFTVPALDRVEVVVTTPQTVAATTASVLARRASTPSRIVAPNRAAAA